VGRERAGTNRARHVNHPVRPEPVEGYLARTIVLRQAQHERIVWGGSRREQTGSDTSITPFVLSLSKGSLRAPSCFDKLSTNGIYQAGAGAPRPSIPATTNKKADPPQGRLSFGAALGSQGGSAG
tara:strand:- start:4131 stop:4505 length:375 start_codon:yes stop_codon:yes gene_type:complete